MPLRPETPLPRQFYDRDARQVAPELLGCVLVRQHRDGLTAGIIVETEAYLSGQDPGSHAFRGQTRRNSVLFGPPGHAYIYRVHRSFLLNLVAGPNGFPAGVLIRALQPTAGLELMRRRREKTAEKELCSGPGKLCQALGITLELYGTDLTAPPLYVTAAQDPRQEMITTTRVGLTSGKGPDLPFRYYLADNQYVSRK